MAAMQRMDDIFGYMPFDHYLVDKWNPRSSLEQETQEKHLVKTWISLGRNGRSAYIRRCREDGQAPVPSYIPTDLRVFEKRKEVDPDDWGEASAVWIRTWYGNETDESEHPDEETVTRTSSDAAYARLWQKALWPMEKGGFDDRMFGPYVFDQTATAYSVSARDADDEVELMNEIPAFILNALVRCPDAMEGSRTYDGECDPREDENLKRSQALLVAVADGEACEDGWVLLIALNDRGQVLPMRVRCKASHVGLQVAFWRDGGKPLDIEFGTENIMNYLDPNQSGDGWDDG